MEGFLEWMLESSLLICMILGIRKVFMGRIRYGGIYALWIVVLLRFMIPVNIISTPFSVGTVVSEAVSSWKEAKNLGQDSKNADTMGNEKQGEETTKLADVDVAEKIIAKQQQKNLLKVKQEQGTDYLERENAQISSFKEFMRGVNWKLVFRGGWGIISGMFFLWLVLSNVCLLEKLKQNRVLYGKRGRIKIYASSSIKNPCLYGFFRPAIYLPEALVFGESGMRVDKEELEQIITHEYVHYLHRDYIWAMFRMFLVSVYWFDPFMWLAVSCSKKDAELFCDETVIGLLGEEKRFSYGVMLVRLAGEARWGDFRYSMMPMSRRGKEMEKRIRAISVKKHYSKWVLIPLVAILSVAVGITCSTGVDSLAGKEVNKTHQAEENKANSEKNHGGEGKGQKKETTVHNSEEGRENQVSIYSDFLKAHAGEGKYRYYSLALLGGLEDGHMVLLASTKLNKIYTDRWKSNVWWGSSACEVYNIVDGKVVLCGNLSCDGEAKAIRWVDGKLQIYRQKEILPVEIEPESDELLLQNIEEEGNGGDSSDKQDWIEEFEGMVGMVFYTNPFIEGKVTKGEPETSELLNDATEYMSLLDKELVYSSTFKEAFQHYIEVFTEAVNTGNTDKMSLVLAPGSEVYDQQCALAKNYHKRGIREEIKSCSVVAAREITDNRVEITSKEKIKVFYADSTSKFVKQRYVYTCEYIDRNWIITKMEEK